MNSYEARQEARRERYERLAAKCEAASSSAFKRARQMASVIPFGQPILVGHYSEKRDRAYRNRIWRMQDRAGELSAKARYFAEKAASVGKGGISSDDPEAVEKLRLKVIKLERLQDVMRKANAIVRSKKLIMEQKIEEICFLGGISEGAARRLFEPDFCGRVGFADYQLKNNNANIRRIRERIAELERSVGAELVERDYGNGIQYREDPIENRVMLVFPGKPSDAIRSVLKNCGFRWSPDRGAWVRMLNNAGRACAKWALDRIAALQKEAA